MRVWQITDISIRPKTSDAPMNRTPEHSTIHYRLSLAVDVLAPNMDRGEIVGAIEDAIQGVEFDDPPGPDDPPTVDGRRKVG